eukprot:4632808-Amphidinium_carterae.1
MQLGITVTILIKVFGIAIVVISVATVSCSILCLPVSQTFVSQCPFLQFGDMVYINGPKCGRPGTWTDPST